MPILHAIVLGLVQGLSEFLPISSSAHLLFVPWLLGWDDFSGAGGESLKQSFDVALHLGTFVAVLGYFRKDVKSYVVEGTKLVLTRTKPVTTDGRLAWLFVLATIPAAAIGAIFEDQIGTALGSPLIIALSLIGFGILLGVADRAVGTRKVEDFRMPDSLKVGMAQALALNPGTSRSGITMTAARWIGFDRDAAVRISFVMSLPVIFGAVVFKMLKMFSEGGYEELLVPMAVGIVTSCISGLVAVWGTIKLVSTRNLMPFVIYRIAVGVLMLVILAFGWRENVAV
ncbi:undecaprenyl-diphosphate phosphatase [uncultured Ilumatobacter sp.]|uniref:undecaprenyl-diphosphate phosphatase n=1 Tax=uncultured Ilumatobacter sp. TaxID=879968 RepID=UPI00374F92B8